MSFCNAGAVATNRLAPFEHSKTLPTMPNRSICRILHVPPLQDRVDSLVWAHNGLRFASGSRDGLAKVWTVKCGDWVAQTLDTHLRSQV